MFLMLQKYSKGNASTLKLLLLIVKYVCHSCLKYIAKKVPHLCMCV